MLGFPGHLYLECHCLFMFKPGSDGKQGLWGLSVPPPPTYSVVFITFLPCSLNLSVVMHGGPLEL